MNKYQKAALKYASISKDWRIRWHSFAEDKKTTDAICGLHNAGLVIDNGCNQFKITPLGMSQEQITIKQYHKIVYSRNHF